MFGKKKIKGKNERLNMRINALEMDMENNYKDAAQLDYRQVKEIFASLKAEHALSAKDEKYYEELIAQYDTKLAHFTHWEGPGTGRYQG